MDVVKEDKRRVGVTEEDVGYGVRWMQIHLFAVATPFLFTAQ